MEILKLIFNTFTDIFLKMTWLSQIVNSLLTEVFKISETSSTFSFLSFFIYDVIKIFILLGVLIYISSYIQSYFTVERTRRVLGEFKGIKANTVGALMGTLTPFCSCSSIPIFIGFTRAGLPIGVTFSFLISSPLVDMASILLLATIFGVKVALFYVVFGLIIAVVGGTLISHMNMEKYIEPYVLEGSILNTTMDIKLTKKDRHVFAFDQVKEIFGKVKYYILIGVGIGALIHGYIPQDIILGVLGSQNIFSVWIASLVGIPIYSDIFGALPIAEALVYKGVEVGTVLSFMMAVTALSLPSMILLKKVVKPKLLGTFFAIVTFGIIFTGYIFNFIF